MLNVFNYINPLIVYLSMNVVGFIKIAVNYQNIYFFMFHLRLDSLNASIIIYWYIDKNKYKSLLTENDKISTMSKEKGDGFWCVGSNSFDESGLFWNFINGSCQFRSDRLKMIARKEEGSWYLHIPAKPAIIGHKLPLKYHRGYNKKYFKSTKTFNTKSQQYETYNFKTLYHDENNNNNQLPCNCDNCTWYDIDNKYPEYIEIGMDPEVLTVARNTIKIAAGVTKSLSG
eukprot:78065_1